MIILAIETSCDDTCVAVLKIVNYKLKILSNVVSSQEKLHAKYGGVYPFLAKREHQRNLAPVLKKSLEEARLLSSTPHLFLEKVVGDKIPRSRSSASLRGRQNLNLNKILSRKIDFIAVTVGPGLEPCLWTGINFAKNLAKNMKLPIVPINHIEAHIFANFVGEKSKAKTPRTRTSSVRDRQKSKVLFPAVCLVVSGGHTQLILMKNFGKYRILGETRDDAAGECFDKTARILNLGYPGGPAIAAQATKFDREFDRERVSISLPRPMVYQKNYDFSFSGLKTAVLYDFKKRSPKIRKSKQYLREMSAEIQQAIIDVLIHKTLKIAKDYKVKSIILAGGVVANEELRKQFISKIKGQKLKVKFLVPPKNLCTDNAAMVAVAGYFNTEFPKEAKVRKKRRRGLRPLLDLRSHKWELGKRSWKKIKANANLRIDELGTF